MSIKKHNFLLKPLDFVTILLFLVTFIIFFSMIKTKAQKLIIEISTPEEIYTYDMASNREFSVEGTLGQTKIKILDNTASIMSSPCSNKTCIHQGKISKAGQWLCCAPNQVIVVIKDSGQDAEKTNEPDAISF